MVLLNLLLSLSSKLPPLRLDVRKLQQVFYNMGIVADARSYVTLIILLALLSAILSYFSLPLGATLLLVSAFLYFLPFMELSSLKMEIEAEMPTFLRQLGSLMKMGLPFVEALRVASGEGTISQHMAYVLRQIERGVSVQKAFSDFAEKLATDTTKRAVAQIISVYGHGGGEELKRLGDELLSVQRHKLKEYSSKSSMLALFFVMVAVVAPTFYLVAVILGQSFSSTSVEPLQAVFILDILVPSICLLIAVVGVALFPSIIFSKKELNFSIMPFSIVLALLFFLPIAREVKLLAFVALFLFSLYRFWGSYVARRELDELEANLADSLLVASSLPKGAHLKEVFAVLCRNAKGKLSREFCISSKQLKANMSIGAVLNDLKERVKSKLFSKTVEVLEYAFKSGRNIGDRIAELAEDLLMFMELKREQSAMLSIQKYSLLIGILIVPLILSSTFSIIASFKIKGVEGLPYIRDSAVPAYLVLISGVTAVFITTLEGNKSSDLLYFSLLSLATVFIYFNLHFTVA
ncbi:MAG: hypothetical protein D6769_00435 [Methanobacteriota archaeon]|nr:MAG: hypothetical protein D6769_00435 [Euryarchaeota archaeon]